MIWISPCETSQFQPFAHGDGPLGGGGCQFRIRGDFPASVINGIFQQASQPSHGRPRSDSRWIQSLQRDRPFLDGLYPGRPAIPAGRGEWSRWRERRQAPVRCDPARQPVFFLRLRPRPGLRILPGGWTEFGKVRVVSIINDFELAALDFDRLPGLAAKVHEFHLDLRCAAPVGGAQGVGQVKAAFRQVSFSSAPFHHNTVRELPASSATFSFRCSWLRPMAVAGLHFQSMRGQGQFFVAGAVGSQAFERLRQIQGDFGQAEPAVNLKIAFCLDFCPSFRPRSLPGAGGIRAVFPVPARDRQPSGGRRN